MSSLPAHIGIILVDHGSTRSAANALLDEVAALYRSQTGARIVAPAHMELAPPTIADAFATCVAQGATEVIIHPYFLAPGRHSTADIPALAAAAAAAHPGVRYRVTAPLGLDARITEVIQDRVLDALRDDAAGCQRLKILTWNPFLLNTSCAADFSGTVQEQMSMAATVTAPAPRSAEFEREVMHYLSDLYAVAFRLTRNRLDAQDLVQDTIVRALRFHQRFEEGTYMKAWLLTILRNTFINAYRRKRRRPPLVDWPVMDSRPNMHADPDLGYYPEQLKLDNVLELLDDEVRQAVEALPEGHRLTVIMADLKDMTYQEIAAELDCPLGTVMSRLHRGRRLLREALENYRSHMAVS